MAPPLLAREDELAALGACLAAIPAGTGSVTLIEGPAGIGKTALLDAATPLAAEHGIRVLRARASELDRDFAYGVVHQLVGPELVAAGDAEREALLSGAAAGASFLLPGHAAAAVDAFAALHGLHWLVLGLAERAPLLLVVDDLHWADVASLRMLEHLARRIEGSPVGIVATMRPAEPGAAQEVLDELLAGPLAQVLRPAPLAEASVGAVLERALGTTPDPAFVAAAMRATAGSPLLANVLAREATTSGLTGAASEGPGLETLGGRGVEPMVRRRLRALGDDGLRLALAVAVGGAAAVPLDLAALAGLTPEAALDATAQLVRAEVLAPPGREFVHPLVRAAVLSGCAPSERSRLHGLLASRLRDRGAPAPQIALHLLHTGPAGDVASVEILEAAARTATDEGAPETAADLLDRALSEPPSASDRPRLALALGELEVRIGRPEGPGRLRALIADGLRGDLAARAHAALGNQLVHTDPVAALDELERAAADADEPGLALRLEAYALEAVIFADTFSDRRNARLDAGEVDPAASSAMLAHVAVDRACRGYPGQEVAAIARRAGADGTILTQIGPASSTWNLLLHALRFAEQADAAQAHLQAGERLARDRGSYEATLFVEHGWGYWHRDFGSVATGAARAAVGLDVIRQLGMDLTVPALAAITAENLVHLDRLDEADETIEIPLDGLAGTYVEPFALSARALVRFAQRRLDDAEHDLRRLLQINASRGWDGPHATRARLRLVELLARTDRHEEALALSDLDLAAAERVDQPGVTGSVLRVRAAAQAGDEAIETLQAAVATLTGTPLRLELGWALHDLGARLRVRGDRRDARVPLRDALDLAGATESSRLARHVRSELEASGSRLQRERTGGAAGLTPAERRVADLAVEGLTNRAIAQTLWITPKTVEMHLGRSYGKLGIRSRRELAEALQPAGAD
ncbi:MAG: AAA family ATPase [Solirubrobacteraceae bacterium]|nr:AAA family ATPase [Solirubrobacteraceae bacterium]